MSVISDENIKSIVEAMLGVLNKGGKDLAAYAQAEAAKFAHSIEMIVSLKLAGQIDEQEATLQLNLQKAAARVVLTAVEGITILIAEQALNAGLQAVADIVNKAIGFTLI